ncbi:hypothetical protein LSAT2_008548 [Lamellibrachia satsuma]|nr:hypothetical protein LSAT2_008548 [Lamellibrachia satsuma]
MSHDRRWVWNESSHQGIYGTGILKTSEMLTQLRLLVILVLATSTSKAQFETEELAKTNLALHKPTSQSSYNHTHGGSEKAVDGYWWDIYRPNSPARISSCTSTKWQRDPWWMVDLQANYDIQRFVIARRNNCCGEMKDLGFIPGEMKGLVSILGGIKDLVSIPGEMKDLVSIPGEGKHLICGLTKPMVSICSLMMDDPCRAGGLCERDGDLYRCHCTLGYVGKNCETAVPCRSQPCVNGGACRKMIDGSYTCNCKAGFTGRNCESKNAGFGVMCNT